MTAQTLVTDLAASFAPLAVIFAIAAAVRKREPIGGWLMFFYYQLYAGTLVSAIILSRTYHAYTLRPWSNEARHILFVVAAVPRMVGFLIVASVASILLAKRNLMWLERLRFVFAIELLFMSISLVIDFVSFRSAFQVNFGQFAVFVAWFGYFYGSHRVHRVFVTRDWPSAA
jgi:hypothetical protein